MPEALLAGPLLLTVDQAAVYLGVSRSTVRRLADAGRLPLAHVGRSARISRRALDEFAADLTGKSGERASEPSSPRKIACDGGERGQATG